MYEQLVKEHITLHPEAAMVTMGMVGNYGRFYEVHADIIAHAQRFWEDGWRDRKLSSGIPYYYAPIAEWVVSLGGGFVCYPPMLAEMAPEMTFLSAAIKYKLDQVVRHIFGSFDMEEGSVWDYFDPVVIMREAVRSNHPETVRVLIDCGIDLTEEALNGIGRGGNHYDEIMEIIEAGRRAFFAPMR